MDNVTAESGILTGKGASEITETVLETVEKVSETPEAVKVRKPMQPVETFIGQWITDGDGATVFVLSKRIDHNLQGKEIREELKKLGQGTYDIIKGRASEAIYGTRTVDEFTVGD